MHIWRLCNAAGSPLYFFSRRDKGEEREEETAKKWRQRQKVGIPRPELEHLPSVSQPKVNAREKGSTSATPTLWAQR